MIFTHNLYLKSNVQHSIFISLLQQNDEETKFWTYKLYYSKFKKETFAIIWKLYYELYASFYPNLELFNKKKTLEWIDDMSKDTIIGTIIENIVRREPCVDIYRIINSNDIDEILGSNYPFAISNVQAIKEITNTSELLQLYYNIFHEKLHENINEQIIQKINMNTIDSVKMLEQFTNTKNNLSILKSACISRIFTFMLFFGANEHSINNYNCKIKLDPKKYSVLTKNDIIQYTPKPLIQCKGSKIPSRVCIYSVHNSPNSTQILMSDYDHWLYYASFSSIWENRISKYEGIIDNENKNVIFKDEDKEEMFYNLYNFDPIEQFTEIQSKWLGKWEFRHMNEIYEKYKCESFRDWIKLE